MKVRKWFDNAYILHLARLLALMGVYFVADYYHFQHRTGFQQTSPYLFIVLLYGWIVFHNLVLFNGLYLAGKKRAYFIWTGLALLVGTLNMHIVLYYGFKVSNTLPHILNFWLYTLLGLGVYVIYRYLNELPKSPEPLHKPDEVAPAETTYFTCTVDGEKHSIPCNQIIYLESLENYVKVHTPQKTYLVRLSMKEAGERLPTPPFLRISRSNIVNTSHLTSVAQDTVHIGQNQFKIGKVYKKYVEEQLSMAEGRPYLKA